MTSICLQCSEPLTGRRSDAKWCSNRCSKQARSERCKDAVNAERARYRERHREKLRAKAKAYRAANLEKRRAYERAYYQRHRERIIARALAWNRDNPEARAELARRRGRADGTFLERDWERLISRFAGLCAYCRVRPWAEIDHIIPLARGGRNTIGNVLPACLACNRSKNARLLIEWRGRPKPTIGIFEPPTTDDIEIRSRDQLALF